MDFYTVCAVVEWASVSSHPEVNCSLPWYSWNIADLALKNNHPLKQLQVHTTKYILGFQIKHCNLKPVKVLQHY
jgi:hypothetical protein